MTVFAMTTEAKARSDKSTFSVNDVYAAIAEMIGTLFFVFLGLTAVQAALTLGSDSTLKSNGESSLFVLQIATAFGISLMVCISMVAKVSGGHLNPAVTVALCASGIVSIPKAIMYVFAQTIGATIGAAFANLLTPGPLLGVNSVSPTIDVNTGFWSEVLLAFVLVLTVFTAAVDKTENNSGFAPFYIGFSVFAIHLSGITIAGASVNPARSFGAAAVAGKWDNHWVYWVGPIFGGLLAAGVFRFFEYVNTEKEKLE
jgi:MIP family channel proteins